MGVGKTAVGRELARLLAVDFADTDRAIEARTGVDIGFIFDKEGEAGFRQRESAMLDTMLKRSKLVLATGGGIVLAPVNRERIAAAGTTIYLTATLDTQLERTSHSRSRPLLEEGNRRDKLQRINSERAALYETLADITIATDNRAPHAIARDIRKRLLADY